MRVMLFLALFLEVALLCGGSPLAAALSSTANVSYTPFCRTCSAGCTPPWACCNCPANLKCAQNHYFCNVTQRCHHAMDTTCPMTKTELDAAIKQAEAAGVAPTTKCQFGRCPGDSRCYIPWEDPCNTNGATAAAAATPCKYGRCPSGRCYQPWMGPNC